MNVAGVEQTMADPVDGTLSGGKAGTLHPGMVIAGKFTLLRRIAEGGVGAVFEAEDIFIGRRVALKLMLPKFAHDPDSVRRFRREAQATAAVQHPNVVTVLEMGQRRDGSFYIAQELLQGQNLREHLLEHKCLGIREALSVVIPIMRALVAAHQAGIVHRDVKPENIVLTRSNSGEMIPKLVDFGIAQMQSAGKSRKLTQVGLLLGTASYMSPEQASGIRAVDARSDVWAIGAILFELLSGSRPYQGNTEAMILVRILSEPVPRIETLLPDIPPALAEIVHGALEPDPAKRFSSMQVFVDKLVAFAHVETGVLQPAAVDPLQVPPAPAPPVLAPVLMPHEPEPLALGEQEVEIGLEEPIPVVADPAVDPELPPEEAPKPVLQTMPRARRNLEWAHDRPSVDTLSPDDDVYAAEEALRVNALGEAIAHAEAIVEMGPAAEHLRGRMRLVQAVAHRWLGSYMAAERCALEAASELPQGSTGWYAAVGHVIIAAGYLGRSSRFGPIIDELAALEASGESGGAYWITLCRLVIFLVRSGSPDIARRMCHRTKRAVDASGGVEPIVVAWLDAARAEIAVHLGDPMAYMQCVQSAVENFTSAGDARNACLQRANIGNAYMQLGAYGRAAAAFHEALTLAEPMRLDFVTSLKVNLGLARGHLGQLDEALAMETSALEQTMQQGNRRMEGCARIYLAVILSLRNDLEGAASAAQEAITAAEGIPALYAYALATLASVWLMQNLPHLALNHAREAMNLLEKLEGVEEGESLIHVVYALSLRGTGSEPEGRRRILEARERLIERAARISDPRWRQSFLDNVPDNARLLHLADQWLEDHSRNSPLPPPADPA